MDDKSIERRWLHSLFKLSIAILQSDSVLADFIIFICSLIKSFISFSSLALTRASRRTKRETSLATLNSLPLLVIAMD